jgi:hypothetical protein
MFNLKDKVKIIHGPFKGWFGNIVAFSINSIGVQFDKEIEGGHDCNSNGKQGRCYYFDDDNLILCS